MIFGANPKTNGDAAGFPWRDGGWQRPRFRDLVIYELHIGTFTPAGTFRGAIDKLPHLRALHVNAIEIMPIGDFPGRWGGGYDGVLIYAPSRAYGTPDDLRALVDAAHQHGFDAETQSVTFTAPTALLLKRSAVDSGSGAERRRVRRVYCEEIPVSPLLES